MLNTHDFITNAQKVHNNKYDYSKIKYINAKTKVTIVCKKHGEFLQLPSEHVAGRGCKKCATDKSKLGIENFIKKANKIHKNKYDYSKSIYVSIKKKIEIICPVHGSFFQTPNNHFHYGCKKCSWNVAKNVHGMYHINHKNG